MKTLHDRLTESAEAFGEENDGAVRAFAVVTSNNYKRSHAALLKHGRLPTTSADILNLTAALAAGGFEAEQITIKGGKTAKTVASALNKAGYADDTILVQFADHFAGFADCELHDSEAVLKSQKTVKALYKINIVEVGTAKLIAAEPIQKDDAVYAAKGKAYSAPFEAGATISYLSSRGKKPSTLTVSVVQLEVDDAIFVDKAGWKYIIDEEQKLKSINSTRAVTIGHEATVA